MLHIYPAYGIFYLPSIDTGTQDCQLNVSSEQHPAEILLMKVDGKFWVLHPRSEPGTFSATGEHLTHCKTCKCKQAES